MATLNIKEFLDQDEKKDLLRLLKMMGNRP